MKQLTICNTKENTQLEWDMIPDEIITKIAAACKPEIRNYLMYASKRFNELVSKKNKTILYHDTLKLSGKDTYDYLLLGCDKNDYPLINNLLTLHSSSSNKNNTERAIRYAIDKNNLELISFLLTSMHSAHKTMALFYAIKNKSVNAVQTILTDYSVAINDKDKDGSTPLHYAAGKTATARKLTFDDPTPDNFVFPFSWNTLADTGLIQKQHTEMVSLLIARNDIQVNAQDNMAKTALDYATKKGYTAIVHMLRNP